MNMHIILKRSIISSYSISIEMITYQYELLLIFLKIRGSLNMTIIYKFYMSHMKLNERIRMYYRM